MKNIILLPIFLFLFHCYGTPHLPVLPIPNFPNGGFEFPTGSQKRTVHCPLSYTCKDNHTCCPDNSGIVNGLCCYIGEICTYASPNVHITVPNLGSFYYGCCDTIGQIVCSITYDSAQNSFQTPCCFPNQTCCGYFCCNNALEICCINQPFYDTIGPLCLPPTLCCSSDADCPTDAPCCQGVKVNEFNQCCNTSCCNGTCCEANNSTFCCANGKCRNSLSCSCDTKNPNDNVCQHSTDPITGIPTTQCCSEKCCGPVCCSKQQSCCLNQTDQSKICVSHQSCCGGVICENSKNWYCCQNNQCVRSILCATGFVDGVNFIIATMSLLWFAVMLAGVGVLLLLCCLCCCWRYCKKHQKKEESKDDIVHLKNEMKELHNQNKILEEKNLVFMEEKAKLEAIKEEKDKLEFEMEKFEALKEENERLENENKILSEQVKVPDPEPLGPIQLVIVGGSFLQEKTIFAQPHVLMGNIIENFCKDNTLKRLEYAFFTKTDIKKYVDETKTAHENGYINGTRIIFEKAADNKLWKKKVDDTSE